eukprot:SAG22_NODE_165_length_16780_cov_57.761525_5_plen_142_part_00
MPAKYSYNQQKKDAGKGVKVGKIIKKVKKGNKKTYHELEVSKLCAELKVGDKIEIMFNDAKNTDAKHIPKWYRGEVVDLEGKAKKHGLRYTITKKQKKHFWVKVLFDDDDTFYWIDRFGPDSFEIFREDLGPDDETEEESE